MMERHCYSIHIHQYTHLQNILHYNLSLNLHHAQYFPLNKPHKNLRMSIILITINNMCFPQIALMWSLQYNNHTAIKLLRGRSLPPYTPLQSVYAGKIFKQSTSLIDKFDPPCPAMCILHRLRIQLEG